MRILPLKPIRDIIVRMRNINRQAAKIYAPVVEDLIRSRSRDINLIENTLDGILDFCGYKPSLRLYRRLCSYYKDIDPTAADDYVRSCHEMWGGEASGPVTKPPVRRKSPPKRTLISRDERPTHSIEHNPADKKVPRRQRLNKMLK